MSEFEDKLNTLLSSPEDMEKIMKLAQELSGSAGSEKESKEEKEQDSAGIDPRIMGIVTKVMSAYSKQKSDKKQLVESLKPYVSPQRGNDLEKAVKIMRLYHAAKVVLKELGGEIHL